MRATCGARPASVPWAHLHSLQSRRLKQICAQPIRHDGSPIELGLNYAAVAATVAALSFSAFGTLSCWASEERKVGEFKASGLVFKDTVQVLSVEDPDVEGVTLYYSDFKRSFVDKLSKLDFFNEPSQASITCAATSQVRVKDLSKVRGQSGRDVFSEDKGRALVFFGNKTLKIRRIYDEEKQALLYVSYSSRLTSAGEEDTSGKGVSAGRYRTSICVVPVQSDAPVELPS